MNLFLYIPPNSAHPPWLVKSLIFGLLQTYHRQNSKYSDFLKITTLLFQRLIDRGHLHDNLVELFSSAIESIEKNENNPFITPPPITSSENRLFLHTPYHPRDISRKQIRDLYESTCESSESNSNFKFLLNPKTKEHMSIDKLTVAYSRPKNLRDLLVSSTFQETEDVNVAKFVKPFTPPPPTPH